MDEEFFENREGCSEHAVNRDEIIKDFESKGPEEAQAEIGEMLKEVASVMEFVGNRLAEISNKHKSTSIVGRLGLVAGVSFCGEPVSFIAIGTGKAINDSLKVIMAGMVHHAD